MQWFTTHGFWRFSVAVLTTLCVLDSCKDSGLCNLYLYLETTNTAARDTAKTAVCVFCVFPQRLTCSGRRLNTTWGAPVSEDRTLRIQRLQVKICLPPSATGSHLPTAVCVGGHTHENSRHVFQMVSGIFGWQTALRVVRWPIFLSALERRKWSDSTTQSITFFGSGGREKRLIDWNKWFL